MKTYLKEVEVHVIDLDPDDIAGTIEEIRANQKELGLGHVRMGISFSNIDGSVRLDATVNGGRDSFSWDDHCIFVAGGKVSIQKSDVVNSLKEKV